MFHWKAHVKVARNGTIWLVVSISTIVVAQTKIQAKVADAFVASMGINVHMAYVSTPYGHYKLINERLGELGMRHFRDEINDTDHGFVSELNHIGALGYSLCGLIEGGNDYPRHGRRLKAGLVIPIIQNLEPVIDAVEGPNEPDNLKFVYDHVHYPSGAINESVDLWNIVKGSSDSKIRDLRVLAMSEGDPQDFLKLARLTPPPIDYATFGNMHAYQGGSVGNHQLGDLYIPLARKLTGTAPLWTTEMGYHNNTHYLSDNEQQGVSPRAAAIYLPIAFLSGFNRGVLQTFAYELIDESNDPNLTDGTGSGHYGLLNYDGSPKPAFTALKNLIALLREPSVPLFDPGSLEIGFAGAPQTMQHTLLEKSNGEYYLAVWNDVRVYRPADQWSSGMDLYPQAVPVTISFAAPEEFTVYAPNDASGIQPTDTYTLSTASDSLTISLPAQVLLIKVVSKN